MKRKSEFDEEPERDAKSKAILSQNHALQALVNRLQNGGVVDATTLSHQGSNYGFSASASGPVVPEQRTKDSRDLFVGNVEEGTQSHTLKEFLNAALRQVGLNTTAFDPIIAVRVQGKYCFIECYTIDDASNALNLNGIPFGNMFLKVTRPAKYQGPNTPARLWQEMVGQEVPSGIDSSCNNGSNTGVNSATRAQREIFIGNTGPDMSEEVLKEFIGGALHALGFANFEGVNPVHNLRISKQFCFVELRTLEEASNLLNLNDIPFHQNQLKISRPSKFINLGTGLTYYAWDELLARWATGEIKLLTSGNVTNILCITNMTTAEHLSNAELIDDTIEDTMEECAKFGNVKTVISPKEGQSGYGMGRVFVEMETEEHAKSALIAMKGKKFDDRVVDIKFYPSDLYQQNVYGEALPIAAITSSGIVNQDQILNTN